MLMYFNVFFPPPLSLVPLSPVFFVSVFGWNFIIRVCTAFTKTALHAATIHIRISILFFSISRLFVFIYPVNYGVVCLSASIGQRATGTLCNEHSVLNSLFNLFRLNKVSRVYFCCCCWRMELSVVLLFCLALDSAVYE